MSTHTLPFTFCFVTYTTKLSHKGTKRDISILFMIKPDRKTLALGGSTHDFNVIVIFLEVYCWWSGQTWTSRIFSCTGPIAIFQLKKTKTHSLPGMIHPPLSCRFVSLCDSSTLRGGWKPIGAETSSGRTYTHHNESTGKLHAHLFFSKKWLKTDQIFTRTLFIKLRTYL